MLTLAAFTGPLAKLGVIAVAALAATSLIARRPPTRVMANVGGLVLAPVLLLLSIWSSPQLRLVHRHPLLAAAAAALGVAVIVAGGVMIARWPVLLGPLAVLALPFRVPIQASGSTSNLLVPLYLVVAVGSVAAIVLDLRGGARRRHQEPGWIERLLALSIVLYGLQAVYSGDFQNALQQMVFFYLPFSLLFGLLVRLDWTPRLVRSCFVILVGLAVVFAAIGFVEYATKTVLLNPKLVAANSLHTYFSVNSVFFDPDIFGRFLALVMIGLAVLLLYERRRREHVAAVAILAVLWGGLVLTLSRSSLGALLVGLTTLAALRWRLTRTLAIGAAAVTIGAAAVGISPTTFGLNQGLNGASSGRASLISGGATLFADRPVWGYGSGSFAREYRLRHRGTSTLSASHAIPVTIAAEQGVIGELAYLSLVVVSGVSLLRGARGDPARAAIAAAFLALVFHTLLYADFLEDPVTWALLGVGAALAVRSNPRADFARACVHDPSVVPTQGGA